MQFPLEKTVLNQGPRSTALIETVLSRDSLYCNALPQLAKRYRHMRFRIPTTIDGYLGFRIPYSIDCTNLCTSMSFG